MAIFGPWEQPIFEGWSVLAGLAPVTTRVRLGLMVGANTFRNPGLTAKLATTLDHISDGRAVLGIGGAWFEREHDAFGIDFGAAVGERLDRLDESVMLMRRLLDGERFTPRGPLLHVPRRAVRAAPDPGATCRSWSAAPGRARRCGRWRCGPTAGTRAGRSRRSGTRSTSSPSTAPTSGATSSTIEKTISFPIVLRDDRAAAEAAYRSADGPQRHRVDGIERRSCSAARPRWPTRSGRIVELGFETVIVRMPAPYDRETIDRMAEVARAPRRVTA